MTDDLTRAEAHVLGADDMVGGGEAGGVRLRFLATGAETAGALTVFEYTAPPGFAGPPLHIHRDEDEAFFVLDGELTIQSGEDRRLVGPGTYVWAPRGVPHGFANLSIEPARFLGWVTPSGLEVMLFEILDYVREAAPNIDPARMVEINERFVEVVGPPIGLRP